MSDLKDVFHVSNDTEINPSTESLLIFFITGNPGLISYYNTFLTLCYSKLHDKPIKQQHITMTGVSLRGFNVSSPSSVSDGPYDLDQQILHIEQSLEIAIKNQKSAKTKVVLMGHSVGSYILLEVLRRRTQRLSEGERLDDTRVVGGICLFPTVTHIAKSPSGKKFSKLVGVVTGMPSNAAQVTTAFLKSPHGVRQALHLAKHEMQTITTDAWDNELWGVTTANAPTNTDSITVKSTTATEQTKLFFYFGTNDHWVADETRDELIAARASKHDQGEDDKPIMEIDNTGIPHGFCIRHNEVIAEKVVTYLGSLLG